jgi:hypothetical protein
MTAALSVLLITSKSTFCQEVIPKDGGFWYDSTAQKCVEVLISRDSTNTVVISQKDSLIGKLREDKIDLHYEIANWRTLYDITEKQYQDYKQDVKKGFNLLEVAGIVSGAVLITAIITLILK